MLKKLLTPCNIYITLFVIYNMQGSFYPIGSIIAKVILFIILLYSMYYWIYANLYYKLNSVMKAINLLLLMFTIYGILYYMFGTIAVKASTGITLNAFDYLKGVYKSLMPIYPLYVFARKGCLNEKIIMRWIPVFIIACTGSFIGFARHKISVSTYDIDGLTNNIAYDFLSLFPLLFFYRNKKLFQWILLIYIMIFIVYGMKRGAILIGILLFLIHLYQSLKESSMTQKILVFILLLSFCTILFKFIQLYLQDSMYFQYRLEQTLEGDTSGRDKYYTFFLNYIFSLTCPIKLLFGGGAYETVRIYGNLAHNDWLEILVNNGIFGGILYLSYMSKIISYTYSNRRNKYYNILLPFIVIYFLKTFFSMSYTSYSIYVTVALAYTFSQIDTKSLNKNDETFIF